MTVSDAPGIAKPTALQAAQARIAATRRALRAELIDEGRPDDDAGAAGQPGAPTRLWRRWRRRLRTWPLAGMALQALHGWWRRHPLQPTAQLLANELSASVAPLVRRHPVASVAAAAALGSLVMAVRPWRWPAFGATVRSVPGQAVRALQQLLSNPAVQAAIIGWMATSMRGADKPAAAQDAAAEAAAPSASSAGGSSAEMQVP